MDVVDFESFAPAGEEQLLDSVLVLSQPFVGQWSRLVSTTNWEKGRIIVAWREALIADGAPVAQYSDETWGRLVGGVTGQHVGRLRRVSRRFGQVQRQYEGLYWSHFQAALDWADAEMWLEGARQSGWSVNQMREQRWQTLGQLERNGALPESLDAPVDEDGEQPQTHVPPMRSITGEYAEVSGPRHEGPDFGDEPTGTQQADYAAAADWDGESAPAGSVESVRPFERLPDLPDDMAEAFDALKLAILRHKTDGWRDISAADVLLALDALKTLATAPADAAPF